MRNSSHLTKIIFIDSITESPLVIRVIEPFQDDGKDGYLICPDGVNQPPTIRKIVLPKVVDTVFLNVMPLAKVFSGV